MLRQRIISGSLLAAAMLIVIFTMRAPWVAGVFALLFLLAAWEWGKLSYFSSPPLRILYVAVCGVLMFFLWPLRDTAADLFLLFVAIIWAALLVFLAAYERSNDTVSRWQWQLGLLGFLLLPAAWLAFINLHQIHPGWLLYLMVLCVTSDSFAYFFGKALGRKKMAPHLSPGKTREGLMGGLAGVFLLAVITAWAIELPAVQMVSFVFLSLLTGLVSVEGDLFESLLKREAHVKDSGTILPGHGGVLDRFDSHIAGAPVFLVGFNWIF